MSLRDPITVEWLKEVGFRWHQFDRQPDKHWLLWLGDALREGEGWGFSSYEDLGIELAPNRDGTWFCWLRGDSAGRYLRFIHVRQLHERGEVIQLVVALTGMSWLPDNHINGCVLRPEHAEARRRERDRLDHVLMRERTKWSEAEKDDSRGRALPEHMNAAIENGGAK